MKAIIVEDNLEAAETLKHYLSQYAGGISLCGHATSIDEAREMILAEKPDIWLLDIRLHDQVIFSLLKEFRDRHPALLGHAAIIFLTAYDESEYYRSAIQNSAIDYLLKPFDREALFEALDRAALRSNETNIISRLEQLEERLPDFRSDLVALEQANRNILMVRRKNIIMIKLNANSTKTFFLADTERIPNNAEGQIIVGDSRSLDEWIALLGPSFTKSHRTIVINLEHVRLFDNLNQRIKMSNGEFAITSRREYREIENLLRRR